MPSVRADYQYGPHHATKQLCYEAYFCSIAPEEEDRLKEIVEKYYFEAEAKIELALFRAGKLLVNGDVEDLEEARTWENDAIQKYIKELEERDKAERAKKFEKLC
jgi:hypothetical protein